MAKSRHEMQSQKIRAPTAQPSRCRSDGAVYPARRIIRWDINGKLGWKPKLADPILLQLGTSVGR